MATAVINERLLYPSYEIIGGKKIMAPAANSTHNALGGRLYMFIGTYLDAKDLGYCFTDSADVHFPDGSLFKPDFSVVLKEREQIIDWRGHIYGAPDMVVEILSRSTKKKDVTVKKDIYEANGVREYWIVDPWAKSVTVYLLRDGKYFFDEEYILFDREEFEELTDEEKAEVKHEVPVSILDGLTIPLKEIFKWGYN
ncbi:MAG: Uma2 family endonuclease [Selenomonadaceae bacterium]|nr:Uma2 family endonuclease [Selenomonadaceae bacterium]